MAKGTTADAIFSSSQKLIFQCILENSNALIFSVDREFCYTAFNKNHASVMKTLYGTDIKIGKSLLECMKMKKDRDIAKQNIEKALNGKKITAESYSGSKPGARLYFEVSHIPIRDDVGKVIGAMIMAKDMTARKKAEEELIAKNRELEKYNKIFVDRELKMIELKKRLRLYEKRKSST